MTMSPTGAPGPADAVPADRAALVEFLSRKAYELRRDVVDMVYNAGSGHLGGSFSSAEIVATLYWHALKIDPARPAWGERDRLVLSKGHCAPVIYAALARRGYFDPETLKTFRRVGSILQGHPDFRKTPGLDMTSGSLGHGLSVGLGMALASRQSRVPFKVYVLMSDGEMQEGMVWEAAMAAAHYGVGNLTVFVDKNRLQVDGFVADIVGIDPLPDKWRAFGWEVLRTDGHDVAALLDVIDARWAAHAPGRPAVIICDTVKGKGVSWMENVTEWHGGSLDDELRALALEELDQAINQLETRR
jgi:transketolase